MPLVNKHYWALTREQYMDGIRTGTYRTSWPLNLALLLLSQTYEALEPRMESLSEKWHWADQGRYTEDALRAKMQEPETELFGLIDRTAQKPEVGYTLASRLSGQLLTRFWPEHTSVMEIDNLGLYPGNEGGGRGKAYFEMLFARYFPANDVVYWSQHETHGPTLSQFYRDKMRMAYLGTDQVEDFRPQDALVKSA